MPSTETPVVALRRFTGPDRWDAIVIGSGVGGLGAAWLLGAKANKRVLVLERHYRAGGFTHTFRRPGYEWDVGVHYVGQATSPGGLGGMFEELFGEGVAWAPVGDVYDIVVLGSRRYEYLAGRERWRARMLEYFPGEGRAIDAYLAAVRKAVGASDMYWAEKAVAELSTPITTRHFSNYPRGEMYGLAHDSARFVARALRPRTPVHGLWLTGQDICTCGVGGALGGAYLAASAIAGRSLLPRA